MNPDRFIALFAPAVIVASNRPFPSSPPPPFQSEAKCEVFVMKNQFSFILKLDLITITKISHLDSL